MKKILFASLSLLAIASSSCVKTQDDSKLKIINGRVVTESSPAFTSAVRLDLGGGLCTGSVISPRIILTAAHCVENVDAEAITVTFDRVAPGNPGRVGRVLRAETFKPFGAERFPNFDVAFVELAQDVPAPYEPIEILRNGRTLDKKTSIILAGYGNQSDNCQTEDCVGILKETNTEFQNYYDEAHIMSLLVFHGVAAQGLGGACNGDSGGPAYAQVDGKWYLVGITNGLRGDIVPLADGTCASGWDIYTFAGDYIPWLEQQTKQKLLQVEQLNPAPKIIPKVVSGLSQTEKPKSWGEWVNYANHEDSSWYTVDTVLQTLISESAVTGRYPADATEMLYNPTKTEAKAQIAEQLYLQGESVGDLSPLQSFANLQQLVLDGTTVSDLSPLADKGNLLYLAIRSVPSRANEQFFNSLGRARNSIQSLSVEGVNADLVNALDWTQFTSLSNIALQKIDGTLDLSKVQPRGFAGQTISLAQADVDGRLVLNANVGNLELVGLHDVSSRSLNEIVDWSRLSRLGSLSIEGFDRASIPELKDFSRLTQLNLSHNKLSSLADLNLPPTVQVLDVSGNRLASLDLQKQSIRSLRAYDNPLLDTSCPASNCLRDAFVEPKSFSEYCANAVAAQKNGYTHSYTTLLQTIQAQNIGSTRLSCSTLQQIAPRLRYLMLNDSNIADVRPLAYLNQLQYLVLDNNDVKDLSPVLGMTRLEYLSLAGNGLREIPSLATLGSLTDLNLTRNPLVSLKLDAPELARVAFGSDNSPRNRSEFQLDLSASPKLERIDLGGIALGDLAKSALHDAQSLRVLQFFDGQVTNPEEYRDMLSLILISPELDVSQGCPIVNGRCIVGPATAGAKSALGPILGTLSGSRSELVAPSINLPGIPNVVQTN